MIYILFISIIFQTLSAIFSFRLIKTTGEKAAWTLISFALILMALRRGVSIYHLLIKRVATPPDLTTEIVSMVTSLLIMIGFIKISPMIKTIKAKNKALEETNRALKTLSECNQTIIHSSEEIQTMEDICRLVVEIGGYRFAWVGIVENDPEENVKPVAKFGFNKEYIENVCISMNCKPEVNCPIRNAIKTGKTIVARFNDHYHDIVKWREYAKVMGYKSSISLPLNINGVYGSVLNIYSEEVDTFNDAEIKLLEELASDLSYAINAIRINTKKDLAEKNIEIQLQRLSALRKIDISISGSLDLRVVLDVIINQCSQQLNVDAIRILTYNKNLNSLNLKASKGFLSSNSSWAEDTNHKQLAYQVISNREVIHSLEPEDINKTPANLTKQEDDYFLEYYGVPLISKGQVKGVLEVYNHSILNNNGEWKNFLETLGGQTAIAIENIEQYERLINLNTELALAYDRTLEGWSNALDLRDEDTEGHTLRVTEMTMKLAKLMGISDEELIHVKRGALLHDIGKMGIPDKILLKTGPLAEEERKIIQQHPQYAYNLLSPIGFLNKAIDIPYCHHEKWDGSGYPRRLVGAQIPLVARIFAVIDVWDALRSDRPYRKAWPEKKALAYIEEESGKHFDPTVVKIFMENKSEF